MNERSSEFTMAAALRERAEKVLRERLDGALEDLDALSPETLRASLHELRVHQIELEIQNEEMRLAQAALDALRARYFDLYELAPVGYCTVSEQGQILEANLTAATLLRVERGALAGKSLSAFISKEGQELYYRCRKNLLDTRQPQGGDLRMARKDGTAFFAHLEITAARDENGEPVCRVAVIDVTERKKSEAALLNLRTAVEQSANTIVITDIRGNIEYVNPAFEKTTGYTAAEAVGKNPRVLKSGEQDAEFYRHLWATITTGKIWQGEFHNKRKDGSLYWEMATISPVRNDKGEVLRYLAVKEDITQRKAIEASLATALLRAEASAAAKSEFLGVMSHELRTPLNGVLGFAQLLSDTPLDSEQKAYAEMISNSGEHLLAIVSDILDFSSIDAGTLAIHAAPLAVADLVKTAEDTVRKTAAEKGLELRSELAAGVPEQITGDKQRIRQILITLLGNAVKFTASGSVVLRVATSSDGGRRSLDFCVEDTGIGISSKTLSQLFQPFVQADSKKNRLFGGTGLGLAISKRLAEAMEGSITVASTPGKGSTFTFRLPLESAPVHAGGLASVPSHISDREGTKPALTEHRPPVQTGGTPPEGNLVLVVEDDQENSTLAGKMLQSLGYRAEFAAHGGEAVQAFETGKYFAILMDVVMPVMNGLEATRKIRERETGSRIPIIALTANAMPGDRERCLAAGMDDFLSKPFKRDELADKLDVDGKSQNKTGVA